MCQSCTRINLFNLQNHTEVETTVIFTLQMRKPRHREVSNLLRDPTRLGRSGELGCKAEVWLQSYI